MTTPFDDEQAAANALDVAITDALAGDRTDPALAWLTDAVTVAPPVEATERIADRIATSAVPDPARRRGAAARPTTARRATRRSSSARGDLWRWPRIAAAVLGVILMFQGVSSLTSGSWIAQNIGEPFAPHAVAEAGFALIAVGFVALLTCLDRQWLVLGVAAAVPLGVMLGVHGIREVDVWAWGAALHLTEGVLAVVLLASFVIAWRRDRSSA